ncbi:methyltransferase domain-containing protein [Amycolatopsis sp. NBC_00345]|uniref:methyltransferase domain-containing protein n=1 Tax=Amycolatopsis sp. NBC_00345 TaxID=2975955 RepID=UPI002E2748BC
MTFVHGYEFDAMSTRSVNRDVTRALIDMCGIGAHSRVADIGCGSGSATRLLLETSPEVGQVVAVDPSPHELAIARERIADERVTFLQGRAQDVEGLIDPVGVVLLSNVIHQIPEAERASVIGSCHRVLAPAGILALNTHFYEGSLPRESRVFYAHWLYSTRQWLKSNGVELGSNPSAPVALSLLDADAHVAMFQAAGFSDVRVEERTYECSFDDWDALSRYSVFIEGATGLADMALGSEALRAGLRTTFEALGLTTVPRRWLFASGRK